MRQKTILFFDAFLFIALPSCQKRGFTYLSRYAVTLSWETDGLDK